MDYTAYGLRIRSALALPFRSAPPLDEGRSAAERGGAEKRTGADVTVRIGATPAQLPNPIGKHRRWEAAPGAFLMTVDDVARYLVTDGCDVLVEPLGGSERDMGAFLIGPPFAALLQQRGLTTLHASAVETEIGAALFVGHQGAGKSSLASALAERGCALLSDGLTGVEANADGRFLALPASNCTRLRADSLEALGQPPRTLGKVQGESEKHLLPAARLRAEPLAVRAVYVLEPHDRAGIDNRRLGPRLARRCCCTPTGSGFCTTLGGKRSTFAPSIGWRRRCRSFTSGVRPGRPSSRRWRSASRRICGRRPGRTGLRCRRRKPPPRRGAFGKARRKRLLRDVGR